MMAPSGTHCPRRPTQHLRAFVPSCEPNPASASHTAARRYTPAIPDKSGSTHPSRASRENRSSAEKKRKGESRRPSSARSRFNRPDQRQRPTSTREA